MFALCTEHVFPSRPNSPRPDAARPYTPAITLHSCAQAPLRGPLFLSTVCTQAVAATPLQPQLLPLTRPVRTTRPFPACRLVNLERGRADLVHWLELEAGAPWKDIFAKVQSDHPDVWSRWAASGS